VQDTTSRAAKKLSLSLHYLQVWNKLLKVENKGLREALEAKKKYTKHSKCLNLQQREEYHGGATFWSSRKIRDTQFHERTRKREEEKKKLKESDAKKLKATTVLLQKKQTEDRRMAQ
jgi:hypothetical protein